MMWKGEASICLLIIFSYWAAATTLVSAGCNSNEDCGWNSVCEADGKCNCLPGYYYTSNNKDCYDGRCGDKSCLQCGNLDSCLRCVNFIERGTGRCVDRCRKDFVLVVEGPQMGKVCPEGVDEEKYLVVIVSVCGGLLLVALLSLLVFWRYRSISDRNARLKFMEKMLQRQREAVQLAKHKQVEMPTCGDCSSASGCVCYCVTELLDSLRAHEQDLLQMIAEAETRLQHTTSSSSNAHIYRNIVHQLSRVVSLLPADVSLPPDAHPLLHWAHKILINYLHTTQQQQPSPPVHVVVQHTPRQKKSRSKTAKTGAGDVLTSTFRPDQQLVPSDSMDHFRYQPCPELISDSVDSIQQCREVSEISVVQLLADHDIDYYETADV